MLSRNKTSVANFREDLNKDTVLRKNMPLVMWLISFQLKKRICIYEIAYTDLGMRQESDQICFLPM
jgi:hypothetical protein